VSTETVRLLSPEIILATAAVFIYVAGAFFNARAAWSWLAGAAIAGAAAVLWLAEPDLSAAGPLAVDPLAGYCRWLALAVGAAFVLLTSRPLRTPDTPEYVGSLLLIISGLMLAGAADELVLLFLGLELISIPTYIVLYLGRRDTVGREATAKYFFLSILASGLLLYGLSFLYGSAGSTDLSTIASRLAGVAEQGAAGFDVTGKLALVLIFAGLGFKIAAVPFHFYAPDVYQGTSNANAGLLSVVPKAAGFVVLLRVVVIAMPGLEPQACRIAIVLAVLTMTFGNVMALWQDNLRRLLAYSSVANAGYMLIGLAVALATIRNVPQRWDGAAALLFFLTVYAAAIVGTFAMLTYLGREGEELDGVDELAGLGQTCPLPAALLGVFMFSLAGIPPLAGFWGKLALFASALSVDPGAGADPSSLRPWFIGLAVIGVLNAAVAAAYYLRIIGVMYFRLPLAVPKREGGRGAYLAAVVCAGLVVAVGVHPGPLLRESDKASPGSRPTLEAQAGDLLSESGQ